MRHEAFEILGADRSGGWLVTCDHATNRVPDWLGGDLGILPEDMNRHIAFDLGAKGVAIALGEYLNSPVLLSDFSRLVIDPNRGEDDPTLVMKAIHSFTPCLKGRSPRPWHVGVLYSHVDARLSQALIALLRHEADVCLGDNEPYSGHLPGDAIDRHALQHGRHNTLIELRNDLIGSPEDQMHWARRLAPILTQARSLVD